MAIKERIIRKIVSLFELSFFGKSPQAHQGEFAKFHSEAADMVVCFETS